MTVHRLELGADHSRRSMLLAMLVAAQMIISLDFSLVSIALPSIERGLHLAPTASQWVLTADFVTYGGFLIVGGRIADKHGQRFALTMGLSLFMTGSLASLFADNLGMLIGARVLQGLGAALTYPATLSLLTLLYPVGQARYRALTISTAAQAMGIPLGSIVGGALITRFGWSAAFILNVPICALILLSMPFAFAGAKCGVGQRLRIPYASGLLLTVGIGLLIQAALGFVSKDEWTRTLAIYALSAGIGVVFIFCLVQRMSSQPLFPFALFKIRNLAACIVIMGVKVMSGKSLVVLSNISFQRGLHFTALETSLALLPMSLGSLMLIKLPARINALLLSYPKTALVYGFAGIGLLHLILSITPGSSATLVLLVILFISPFVSVVTTNVGIGETLKLVEPEDRGVVSGMLYTAVQIIGGLGFSIIIASTDQSPAILDDFARFAPNFRVAAGACVIGVILTLIAFRAAPARPVLKVTRSAEADA